MALAGLLAAGCGSENAAASVPTSTDELAIPAEAGRSVMLICAADSIEAFSKQDVRWLPVELRDPSAGLLESQAYAPPPNDVGIRVQIHSPNIEGPARLMLWMAGADSTDLAADEAMAKIKSSITQCMREYAAEA